MVFKNLCNLVLWKSNFSIGRVKVLYLLLEIALGPSIFSVMGLRLRLYINQEKSSIFIMFLSNVVHRNATLFSVIYSLRIIQIQIQN